MQQIIGATLIGIAICLVISMVTKAIGFRETIIALGISLGITALFAIGALLLSGKI